MINDYGEFERIVMNEHDDEFKKLIRKLEEDITNHIDEFACAFAKHTNLPPDRIKMFYTTVMRNGNLVNVIWFEEKENEEDGDKTT